MASKLNSLVSTALQSVHLGKGSVPERASTILQNLASNPWVRKTIAALLVLRALQFLNKQLSWYSVNRWTKQRPLVIENELVLVTGGTSGIGLQIATDLAKLRFKVVVIDVKESASKLPPGITFYKADITSTDALKETAREIRNNHGHPTILVNNAGVGHGGTIMDQPEPTIRQTLEVNLLSHFWTVKEFCPNMVENDHGHIISIASMASFVSFAGSVDYACSKAGVLAFHEGLSQELLYAHGAKRVRTSIIHPLWVRTPMIDVLLKNGWKQRVLEPSDISKAVIKQILTQSSGQVVVPSSFQTASRLRSLPAWVQEQVRASVTKDFVRLHHALEAAQAGSNPAKKL